MGRGSVIALAIVALLTVGFLWTGQDDDSIGRASRDVSAGVAPMVEVVLPETLSVNAQVGKLAYGAKCAVCHGTNAAGQDDVAPPLVHKIYEPSHHGDAAFSLAAKNGVRAHHWRFGNMPPVEGVTDGDVKMIVAYVRELQRANGIN
ncbi:c-type cytochrome [Thalassobacter stenotrophicus]|uniref:c-type cytochrome n=1 Tax=Thalassobacter stenotrophicus TaxID=266809 RepID=UPI000D5F7CD6|nr:cytochrome c [Thalassobacter stenotrophicus]PVZ45946.1 cytochrome C [Thalassobacter stenotrophicus]